ncbi:MAG: IS1595 family transposase [Candidatus Binataceae bacterium]
MSTQAAPTTLQDAIRYFSDLDRCTQFLAAKRWPDGVKCPTCGSDQVRYLATRRVWECKTKHPKRQFSAKVGTIFEDSPIGLDKWFAAAWLVANCKNGISSYEIARDLGVTQKTAWFMLHRIRLAMQSGSFEKKFLGEVEADETFIGGLARNMHKDKRAEKIKGTGGAGKAIVMGLLDRETGHVRIKHVEDRQRHTLQKEIRENIAEGSEVFTDAWTGYDGLDREFTHGFVDHAERYVNGRIHTNGLENFWSLLKRGLKGTYVSVEPFHLFRYLDEQAYRYNNRKTNDATRFTGVLNGVTGKRVTYKKLTGKTEAPAIG